MAIDLRSNFKIIALIFLTCFGYYLLFWSGHHYSLDGIVMFEYAKSLLFHHSFQMHPPVVWKDTFSTSIWPIGQTLLYIPILFLLSATLLRGKPIVQRTPYLPNVRYYFRLMENPAYQYASLAMPMITALTAVLVYVMGIQIGLSKKMAATAALVFGLASPATVYARFDYAQPLASLLLLLSIVITIQTIKNRWIGTLCSGIVIGAAVLTRPEILVYGVPALVVLSFFPVSSDNSMEKFKSISRIALIFLILGGFILINQVINAYRFGSPFVIGYQPETGNRFILGIMHISTGLVGNLISPGRGLFLFFPISIFSGWGIYQSWKRSPRLGLSLGSIPILAVILYSAWSEWSGGISWGSRFLIPILPYVTVMAFVGLQRFEPLPRKIFLPLFAGLILLGWVISLQGQLFNFLNFYDSFHFSDLEIIKGDYNFHWQFSPLLAGWNWAVTQAKVDVFSWQMILDGNLRSSILFIAIVIILLLFTVVWIHYFTGASRSLSAPG